MLSTKPFSYAGLIIILLLAASCKFLRTPDDTTDVTDTLPKDSAIHRADTLYPPAPPVHVLSQQAVMATLFQQWAAEYQALCHQAFNAARAMLDADLNNNKVILPRAIIVDIDETILDNSPHSARGILEGTTYPEFWDEWCELGKAEAVPGAIEFLNFAKQFGIRIFYVTNRKAHLKEATMRNLTELGFPDVLENHMFFRTAEASKANRRAAISKYYHITMLIGDNLADFSEIFENLTPNRRAEVTDSLSYRFGNRYIVLPNAMYGDWEAALYDYNFSLSDSARTAIRTGWLQSF